MKERSLQRCPTFFRFQDRGNWRRRVETRDAFLHEEVVFLLKSLWRISNRCLVVLLCAFLSLSFSVPKMAWAALEQIPPDVSVEDLVKPSVVQVRAGATATFRFADRAWPVAVGGTATGVIVSPDGAIVTSSRIVEVLNRDKMAVRRALAERFFNDVQKQVGHRLSEGERAYIAERTTLMEDVKLYRQVVLPSGDKLDFEVLWIGTPVPEMLLPKDPVASRPVWDPHVTTNNDEGTDDKSPPIPSGKSPANPNNTTNANAKEFDPVQEIAVLKIPGQNMPSVLFNGAAGLDGKADATILGYPGNAEASALLSTPTVADISLTSGKLAPARSGKMNKDYGPLLDIEATISPAAAGGPVIASDGKIVGLAGRTAKGPGVYPLINTQAMVNALNKAHISNQASESTRLYASALSMYGQGYTSKAISLFEQLLQANPKHVHAQHILAEARQRQQAGDDKIYWPDYLVALILGTLGVGGIAGGGMYAWLRHKQISLWSLWPFNKIARGEPGVDGAVFESRVLESHIPDEVAVNKMVSQAGAPEVQEEIYQDNVIEETQEVTQQVAAWEDNKAETQAEIQVLEEEVAITQNNAEEAEGKPRDSISDGQPAFEAVHSSVEIGEPVIEFLSGSLMGQTFTIPKEGLLIGRDPSLCQIILDEAVISKQHVFIGPDPFEPDALIVTDKGSTNGTFLGSPDNPRLDGTHRLQDGNTVYLGQQVSFVLRLRLKAAASQCKR